MELLMRLGHLLIKLLKFFIIILFILVTAHQNFLLYCYHKKVLNFCINLIPCSNPAVHGEESWIIWSMGMWVHTY